MCELINSTEFCSWYAHFKNNEKQHALIFILYIQIYTANKAVDVDHRILFHYEIEITFFMCKYVVATTKMGIFFDNVETCTVFSN